jgi:hypothetical protein
MALIGSVEWLPPSEAIGKRKAALVSYILPDGTKKPYDAMVNWPDGMIFRHVAQELACRLVNEHYYELGFSMIEVRGDRPKYDIYLS